MLTLASNSKSKSESFAHPPKGRLVTLKTYVLQERQVPGYMFGTKLNAPMPLFRTGAKHWLWPPKCPRVLALLGAGVSEEWKIIDNATAL